MRSKKTAPENLLVTLYHMNTDDHSILHKPVAELSLSNEFKVMASNNNFKTLQDILHTPAGALLMHERTQDEQLRKISISAENDDMSHWRMAGRMQILHRI